jgi:hypothetical protein
MPVTVAPDGTPVIAVPVATLNVLFVPVPVILSREPHVWLAPSSAALITELPPTLISLIPVVSGLILKARSPFNIFSIFNS